MNKILRQIEHNLGFHLPQEISALFMQTIGSRATYIFDLKSFGSHWFFNADYFLLKPEDRNTAERGEYSIKDFYASQGHNILDAVNKKVSQSVKQHWSEDKVFAFAWSNDVVEKDAALIYVFDRDGSVKGLYIHSMNSVEDKIFVANRLSDIFDLNNIPLNPATGKVRFTTKSSDAPLSYKELLKHACQIIDREFIDEVKDYEFILNILSNLSGGKFLPLVKSLSQQGVVRIVEIEYYGKKHFVQLSGESDYVDLTIIDFANQLLTESGHTRKRFIAFTHASFGHELGVAFIGKSSLKALKELKNIKILKE